MEPADLKSPRPEDDRLRMLLSAAQPALPDNGFTQRVLGALPPAPPRATHFRTVLCTLAAAAGLALAIARSPSLHTLSIELDRLSESWVNSTLPLVRDSGAALALAFAATALSLLYVFRGSFRPPLRSSV